MAGRVAKTRTAASTKREPIAAKMPFEISGLQAWYDASRISGLSNNASIGVWDDLSGNNRTLLQSNGSKKPTYQTSVINGLPGVRLGGPGTGQFMQTAAFTLSVPHTVYMVMKQITWGFGGNFRYLLDGAVS